MSTAGEITMGVSSDIPEVLKALMEYPFSIPAADGEEKDKDKLCGDDDGDGVGVSAAAGGVSASLMPAIWDKTIPYDGETFHLEYMDLDEFLLENGIPASLEEELQRSLAKAGGDDEEEEEGVKDGKKKVGSRGSPTPAPAVSTVTLLPAAELEHSCEELVTTGTPADSQEDPEAPLDPERETPSPIDPDSIEVEVNFQPDPTDLVLSSVPGGELFNPRKHRFSEEELKPQPMIKKARKVFVPEEQKDEKYWSRRRKNNVAAKRSRDARRLKENQITVRAAFLEKENAALRAEVAELRKDCSRCRSVVARYQAKYGPLLLLDADADADMEDL
ncbi:thyrotroph embryonic factor isoform X2 [Lepisosteus oculatus]|uniref:thyrotroph embryonic factor isoform X2 n=1 Tax=Lepisosteus oculatus TaxID=7918 RepID=UPI0035F51A2D